MMESVIIVAIVAVAILVFLMKHHRQSTDLTPYKRTVESIIQDVAFHYSDCNRDIQSKIERGEIRFHDDESRQLHVVMQMAAQRQHLPYTYYVGYPGLLQSVNEKRINAVDVLFLIARQEWDKRVYGCYVSDWSINEHLKGALSRRRIMESP